jgi:hypothetical protein
LVWGEFERNPSLHTCQQLKEHADRAAAWPAWRERALKKLRSDAKQPRYSAATDASELVRVHLWEGDIFRVPLSTFCKKKEHGTGP